jgi:hypothetical protein
MLSKLSFLRKMGRKRASRHSRQRNKRSRLGETQREVNRVKSWVRRHFLIRARDSDARVDAYTYDEKNQMLTARHETGPAVLTNTFSNDGYITDETLVDGGKIEFSYFRRPRNIIDQSHVTDPSGMLTSFFFAGGGYTQSLPHLGGH